MNSQTGSLSEQEKLAVGDELRKLFALQDRPLTKEKEGIILQEISEANLPVGAIIAGIRSLLTEELGSLKFSTIIHAAKKFVASDENPSFDCEHCESRGLVMMRDESGYEFYLSCICQNSFKHTNYAKWDGQEFQMLRGRTLKLRFAHGG